MPFNVSGVFERLYNWATDRDNGVKINAPRMDAETDGIVAGLNAVVNGTQPFIGPVKAPSGTVALPGFAFSGDPDTGMYKPAANEWAVSLGGSQALLLNSTLLSTSRIIRSGNGTASAPALSNASYPNTGTFYPSGGFAWAVAVNGIQRLIVTGGICEMSVPISGEPLRYLTHLVTSHSGTANSIVLDTQLGGGLIAGMEFRFVPTAGNSSGGVTINIGGTGGKGVFTTSGAVLPAQYLRAGIPTRIRYDGTNFIADREPEVITNANGSAIRHADGTQVCDFVYDATGDDWTTAIGSFFTTPASVVWTYPTTFSATPTVTIAAVRGSSHPFGAYMTSVATGATGWRPWSAVSVAATTPKLIHMVARGRWY